jgi:hypothetical protein
MLPGDDRPAAAPAGTTATAEAATGSPCRPVAIEDADCRRLLGRRFGQRLLPYDAARRTGDVGFARRVERRVRAGRNGAGRKRRRRAQGHRALASVRRSFSLHQALQYGHGRRVSVRGHHRIPGSENARPTAAQAQRPISTRRACNMRGPVQPCTAVGATISGACANDRAGFYTRDAGRLRAGGEEGIRFEMSLHGASTARTHEMRREPALGYRGRSQTLAMGGRWLQPVALERTRMKRRAPFFPTSFHDEVARCTRR